MQQHTLVPGVARLFGQSGLEHPLRALLDLQVLVEHIGSEGKQDKVDVNLNLNTPKKQTPEEFEEEMRKL